jgi:hypothetical protein
MTAKLTKLKIMRWTTYAERVGQMRSVYGSLPTDRKEKGHSRDENLTGRIVKINLGETGYYGVECLVLTQSRFCWHPLLILVMNFRVV